MSSSEKGQNEQNPGYIRSVIKALSATRTRSPPAILSHLGAQTPSCTSRRRCNGYWCYDKGGSWAFSFRNLTQFLNGNRRNRHAHRILGLSESDSHDEKSVFGTSVLEPCFICWSVESAKFGVEFNGTQFWHVFARFRCCDSFFQLSISTLANPILVPSYGNFGEGKTIWGGRVFSQKEFREQW